jgi:hypothetical protein
MIAAGEPEICFGLNASPFFFGSFILIALSA